MDTDSFIFYVETEDFYNDILPDLVSWFDTSKTNNKLDRPIRKGINEGILGMSKDELKGEVMTEFIALASKVYAYICDNDKVDKRVKGIKKCVRDRVLMFQHYMDALLLNKKIRAIQQIFKSDHHTITTKEVNKIALKNKDDKRLQTFDGITTYPNGISAFKVCKPEMKIVLKNKHLCYDTYYANDLKIVDNERLAELGDIAIPLYYSSKKLMNKTKC